MNPLLESLREFRSPGRTASVPWRFPQEGRRQKPTRKVWAGLGGEKPPPLTTPAMAAPPALPHPPPRGGGLCPTSARCAVRPTSRRTEATRRRARARRTRFLRARQRAPFCLCAQGGHGDRSPFFPAVSGGGDLLPGDLFFFLSPLFFQGAEAAGKRRGRSGLVERGYSRRLRGPGSRVSI